MVLYPVVINIEHYHPFQKKEKECQMWNAKKKKRRSFYEIHNTSKFIYS